MKPPSDPLVVSLAVTLGLAWVVVPLAQPISSTSHDLRLVEAAQQQGVGAVRTLLAQGTSVDAPQADGATALAWAAHWDDRPVADLLIEAGADVNASNDLGVTPLMLACTNGSAGMVEALLEAGADPNLARPTGETALIMASRTGNVAVVRRLVSRGANVNAGRPVGGILRSCGRRQSGIPAFPGASPVETVADDVPGTDSSMDRAFGIETS